MPTALQNRVSFRPRFEAWDTSAYDKPNGRFVRSPGYGRAFVPAPLPPEISYDGETVRLLARAESMAGELRGGARCMRNPRVLVRPHLKREAVASSRIEGTTATLEDLNMQEALGNISGADSDALRLVEVQNCARALERSLDRMRSGGRGIGQELILGAHEILMGGVRGGDRTPGKLRGAQNAIVSISGARRAVAHVPPPPEAVSGLLDELWAFIADDDAPALVKCAVAHYQFEAIHPFADGNGRVGRMLVPLMLHAAGAADGPLLCVSAYFDYQRQEYYGRLRQVSQSGRWQEWVKFFLTAFAEQAADTARIAGRLEALRDDYAARLRSGNAKAGALELADELLGNPYVTVPRAAKLLGLSYMGAAAVVKSLEAAGILEKTDIKARAKVFAAREAERALR